MNTLEQQLTYPWADTLPTPGATLEVAPGVRWIRMGLPFALDHINLWLLRDSQPGPHGPIEGWTVVDCCVATEAARTQWETIFATQLEGLPILRVIVTHMHPDHIGLAHWLCQRWQAPLWISATDYYTARVACEPGMGLQSESATDFYAAHGLHSPEFLAHVRGRSSYYPALVPSVPESFHRLLDGASVRIGQHDWHCLSGYGHAPEHIALHCPSMGVMISGDMVLPRISTNVSVYANEPTADPLRLFLASLERMRALPEQTLILPSHGRPFRGLHQRLDQLQAHHAGHLRIVLEACGQAPQSAADILPLLFPRALDAHQTTFAMGEALAHLHLLWHAGQITRQQGSDGVLRFTA